MGANIVIANLRSPNSNADTFYGIWNLTRAMKAAGWIYKASADGTNKETTGNFILDKWGPGGIVQSSQLSSQTGAAATINTITGTSVTITGLTGMTTSSVGHFLQFSGAVNSANNGTFCILTFVSATSVTIWNPNAVSEGTSLTWSERVSGTGASVSSVAGDEATLTGLSGLTSTGTPGHLITITNASNSTNNGTFRIAAYISATSCRIKNTSAVVEAGSLTWVENNPTSDIYPYTQLNAVNAWMNMQGPSTMKLPINGASTGTFVRGENITQTTSGAQGELVGYLWDTPTSQGYLVVMPRIKGSGGGPQGWTTGTTDTITGSVSSATVTTFNTPVEFVREVVFWKSTNVTQGIVETQVVDQSAENTSRFSYLAVNAAGVTATIAPGGGGTGNSFPTIGSTVQLGASTPTATAWDMYSSVPSIYGRIQIIAVNACQTTGVSADGTYFMVVGRPDVTSNTCSGFTFSRCDNTEDGDVDPYVWYEGNTSQGNYASSRTSLLAATTTADGWSYYPANSTITQARAWRRRGFGTNYVGNSDVFWVLTLAPIIGQVNNSNNSYWAFNLNSTDPDTVAHAFSPTRTREPIFLVSAQIGFKGRKGSFRWMFSVATGSAMDTYDNKKWIQVSTSTSGTNGTGPFIIGPWDGSTTPIFT